MNYTERQASNEDYEFLYELKKAEEYDAVTRVFGWDEPLQRSLHEKDWNHAKPTIIEISGNRVGSYLLEPKSDGYYFGRFFLFPHYQGCGIGAAVLKSCIQKASGKTIRLCYLQGNQVQSLYIRHGFQVTEQDEHFVHMQYKCS